MKRNIVSLLLALVALLTASGAMAQTLNSSYFMQGTYLRTDMNPALTPERAYVVIPALSGVSAELNTNFFSVDNFFYKKDGQVVSALHSSVSSEEFLGRLPKYEKASMGVNVALFGAGFYKHDMFWNFGANVRVQGDMALSKDIFTVLKTLGNGNYNLSESALGVNAYTEFYVGTTYQILMIEYVRTALGQELGIEKSPGFLKSAEFIQMMETPAGKSYGFYDSAVEQLMMPMVFSFGVAASSSASEG